MRAIVIAMAVAGATAAAAAEPLTVERTFAGSVQLDYLAVPTQARAREHVLDGATVEVSLKAAIDFGDRVSASVKVCIACHGFETGMALFDVRVTDQLSVRVGRFTPAFGGFPQRHDPANHRTSDKPLPYDMGRMLRFREWNEGILPAPWVDNGVELAGSHFLGDRVQLDHAVYAIGGPRGDDLAVDFDFRQSRTPERYYVDNNSEPAVGARVAVAVDAGAGSTLALGLSAMGGRYDPSARLYFWIGGVDLTAQHAGVFVRAEYLVRRNEMALGDDPASRFKYGPGPSGRYDDFAMRDGFYAEVEVPIGRFDLIGRWDGLRRWGNVLMSSPLRSESLVLRYTAAVAHRVHGNLRIKSSAEVYDFSDFQDALAVHVGVAGPF